MFARALFASLLLIAIASPAVALPCLTKAEAIKTGEHAHYRLVQGVRCWYTGPRQEKSAFVVTPAKARVKVDVELDLAEDLLRTLCAQGDECVVRFRKLQQ